MSSVNLGPPHAYTNMCMYAHMSTHMHVKVNTLMHEYPQHTHSHTHTYTHTRTLTQLTHTHAHTHTYTCTHSHTRAHTYTHTHSRTAILREVMALLPWIRDFIWKMKFHTEKRYTVFLFKVWVEVYQPSPQSQGICPAAAWSLCKSWITPATHARSSWRGPGLVKSWHSYSQLSAQYTLYALAHLIVVKSHG